MRPGRVLRLAPLALIMAVSLDARAQYSAETGMFMRRLRSDWRVPAVMQAIRDHFYPTPDMNSTVQRCVRAAGMVPETSVNLQADACLRGALGGLDAFSGYLGPPELKRLMGAADIGSIGLELRRSEQGAEIVSVIEGGPAARAGVAPGGIIVAIDGKSTASMGLPEMVDSLIGPLHSDLSVEIANPDGGKSEKLELRREHVSPAGVQTKFLGGRFGYIRVPQLSAGLARDLVESLRTLLVTPLRPAEGIVIDLRNCPGGLLHGSVVLAGAFLPDDAVVLKLASRGPEKEKIMRANVQDASSRTFDASPVFDDGQLRSLAQRVPLVILVDRGTASGAEAVAGALQEARRAVVLGEATAGMGSVQTVLPLRTQGAIKMTTQAMQLASGRALTDSGVRPDMSLGAVSGQPPGRSEEDPWVRAAIEKLRR